MGLYDRDWFWEGYEKRYGFKTKKPSKPSKSIKSIKSSNYHSERRGGKYGYVWLLILSVIAYFAYNIINDSGILRFSNVKGNSTSRISINPLYGIILAAVLLGALVVGFIAARERAIGNKIEMLKNNTVTLSPQQFFELRNTKSGGRGRIVASRYNFAGVYILYNKSKNMYYVGQGKKILDRVNAHFTGHGNGDVYADYKYGDIFEINMIALENSGFSTLNALERHAISKYNAFSKGYNRTRGNRN